MTDARDAIVLWFRKDLRLLDHPALSAAANSGRPIVAAYILDDEAPDACGAAGRWWLHHGLRALSASIGERGGSLVLRRGETADQLQSLVEDSGASAIYCTAALDPAGSSVESELNERFAGSRVELMRFGGRLLFGPDPVRTGSGGPYQVFTPFYRACLALPPTGEPLAVPERLNLQKATLRSDRLDDWTLTPSAPDWAVEFSSDWVPGEAGAERRLAAFCSDAVGRYSEMRDRPDLDLTSRLSPHLHFGEVSPRQVWHRIELAKAQAADDASRRSADAFLRQLIWREFSYYLLHHNPDLARKPFRDSFAGFGWLDDDEAFDAWTRGRTGYPIVDAGMRQLWKTGWMHNRVRMVAASFLTKHLLISWTRGADWFLDTLVDADVANNSAGWQWVAGSGADAAPYFRIFNPVTQGKKFDPDGSYVRRFVPELARLPERYIHEPWRAPDDTLDEAGIGLGRDYPLPIVDHKFARDRALAEYNRMRESP